MTRIRRFAAIGDVHAEDERLEAALDAIDELGVDAILCVGDVVDGLGDAERTCDLLRSSGAITVRGNHDRWIVRGDMRRLPDATDLASLSRESLAWLAALPSTRELATLAGTLLLCHAVDQDDMTRLGEDDLDRTDVLDRVRERGAALMVCGHTHRAYVRRTRELLVVNAGTLYREHEPAFTVVDLEARVASRHVIDDGMRVREARPTPLP